MNKWIKLIACILVCQMAGVIGSFFTAPSIAAWYEKELIKPDFRPPNWAFAPVWITLYTLMGVSLYWVLNKKNVKIPLILFFFQLALNSVWSILFFGLRNPFYAFIEIIILWIAILLTIVSFYRVSKKAGLILLPYIIWVTIAAILNYYIWVLNP